MRSICFHASLHLLAVTLGCIYCLTATKDCLPPCRFSPALSVRSMPLGRMLRGDSISSLPGTQEACSAGSDEGDECGICMCRQTTISLSCSHCMCVECGITLCEYNKLPPACPFCRTMITKVLTCH